MLMLMVWTYGHVERWNGIWIAKCTSRLALAARRVRSEATLRVPEAGAQRAAHSHSVREELFAEEHIFEHQIRELQVGV